MFYLRKIIITLWKFWKLMNFGLLLATKRTRYDLIYAYDRDGGEIVAYA